MTADSSNSAVAAVMARLATLPALVGLMPVRAASALIGLARACQPLFVRVPPGVLRIAIAYSNDYPQVSSLYDNHNNQISDAIDASLLTDLTCY